MSLVQYDPETGKFTKDGKPFGYTYRGDKTGNYTRLSIRGRKYLGHRVAWLCMTGDWPANMVDHINGDGGDNRWCNLRAATKEQNAQNSKTPSTNKLGLKGVTRHITGGFRAAIKVGGRQVSLGYFKCPAAAYFAYILAAEKEFGEFARAA